MRNSNTSHVFIYQHRNALPVRQHIFKYIPCFYLSKRQTFVRQKFWWIQIHPMFLFIIDILTEAQMGVRFKYIPCFYLSFLSYWIIHRKGAFKYIPCFYLSALAALRAARGKIFKYIPCFYLSWRQEQIC